MPSAITPILTDFTAVLGALVAGLGDVVTFLVGNPLTIIAVGLTVGGLVFRIVRGYIHN